MIQIDFLPLSTTGGGSHLSSLLCCDISENAHNIVF